LSAACEVIEAKNDLLDKYRVRSMRGLNTLQWIINHPLSTGRKLRNVGRFVAWQARSRLSREPYAFEFANRSKMLARSGMTGATGNLYVGLHEFSEMAFLLHYLRPNDLFCDVGANVGSYSILAGAAVGASVVAFEPGEGFEWLVRNFALNHLEHAQARREAVGAKSGTVSFTCGLDTVNRIDHNGAVTVPLTTLDAACADQAPSLIKIDVEGLEADVLRGATRILSNPATNVVIMELNDPAASDLLSQAGFACCSYDPFKRSIACPRVRIRERHFHQGCRGSPPASSRCNAVFGARLDDLAGQKCVSATEQMQKSRRYRAATWEFGDLNTDCPHLDTHVMSASTSGCASLAKRGQRSDFSARATARVFRMETCP
jgi:FkbM family methyltransferase